MDLAELDAMALDFASAIEEARSDIEEEEKTRASFLAEWSPYRTELFAILNVAAVEARRHGFKGAADKNHGKALTLKVESLTLQFTPDADRGVIVIKDGDDDRPAEHTIEETMRQAKAVVKNFLYSAAYKLSRKQIRHP